MWPREREARAIARSMSAEMHSGFSAVRTHMPMNCKKLFPGKGMNEQTKSEIARITQLWRDCLNQYGKNSGAMLFGEFTIADAMYSPVAIRFNTYQVQTDEVCQAYMSMLLTLPAMKEWIAAGCLESEVLPQFEPYTSNRFN